MLRDEIMYRLEGLAEKYGVAFASYRAKREQVIEDGDYMGERSWRRVELQLEAEGLIERKRIKPGGTYWLHGRQRRSHKGIVLVRICSRQQVRAFQRRKAKESFAAERRKAREERQQAGPVANADGSRLEKGLGSHKGHSEVGTPNIGTGAPKQIDSSTTLRRGGPTGDELSRDVDWSSWRDAPWAKPSGPP